jgi:hypothetical protein
MLTKTTEPAARMKNLYRFLSVVQMSVLIVVMALGLTVRTASAANCMQDIYKAGGGSGSLNCSSNDVRIAHVTNITSVSGISGTYPNQSCISGAPIEFTADFEVDLGATGGARYDIGLYLAQGQTQALTGTCNSSIITGGTAGNALHFDQLDSSPDTCGDISGTLGSAFNPQFVHLDIKTTCTAGTGSKLLLPNCTSWRQPGSNEVCTSINDAFPGSPSKCNCDNNFTINVTVEHPTLVVTKSANPTQLDWPGGDVSYTVTVHNPASATPITLTQLTEDDTNDNNIDKMYDATTTPALADICSSTVLAPCGSDPANCASASTATCTFTRSVSGAQGANITDKACVTGTNGGTQTQCDTATVSIKDVVPTAAVTKTKEGTGVCAVVRYDVKVENTDPAESLSLTALCDDMFGDISSTGSASNPACATGTEHGNLRSGTTTPCVLPRTIGVKDPNVAGSGQYNCTFDALVCGFPHTNTVSGTLTDGTTPITKTGSETVTGVTVQ